MNAWSALRKRARLLRSLTSLAEALFVAQAAAFALSVPVLMRLPLARLRRVLAPGRRKNASEPDVERVLGLLELTFQLCAPVLRPTCLTSGLTRYFFLRRAGIDVGLVFGMGQPDDGGFAGHCWLTRNGEPFLERRDPRPVFAEMYRISA